MSKASPFSTVQLADVVDILDNLRIPINSAERMGRAGTVPYYGANGFQGWIDQPLFNESLILLAEDGGNFDDFASRPIAYRIDGPAWVNNHAHIIRAKAGVNQSFIFWSIVNKDIRKYIAGGTRTKLTQGELRRIEINLPIEEEQKGIAAVLDTLDTAIHETEAIIAKLKAVKQGLLHDLLTRGIDANGELRPPQAEAPHLYKQSPLGWIPKEWCVKPLGGIAEVSRGKFTHRPRNDPRLYGGKHPFIQTGDVAAAEGEFVSTYSQTLSDRGVSVSQEFPAGTIAITIAANIADTAILEIPMYFPDSVVGAIVDMAYNVRFIELSIRKAKRILDARAPQSAQKNINLQDLRPLLLAVPEKPEQDAIAIRYETLQNQLQSETDALAKYRFEKFGLMDDLLTGRVRVTPLLEPAP